MKSALSLSIVISLFAVFSAVSVSADEPDDASESASTEAVGDTDGDGVPDDVDNCTNVPNPKQDDTNGDLIGNVCDADIAGVGGPGADDCVVHWWDLARLKSVFSPMIRMPTS